MNIKESPKTPITTPIPARPRRVTEVERHFLATAGLLLFALIAIVVAAGWILGRQDARATETAAATLAQVIVRAWPSEAEATSRLALACDQAPVDSRLLAVKWIHGAEEILWRPQSAGVLRPTRTAFGSAPLPDNQGRITVELAAGGLLTGFRELMLAGVIACLVSCGLLLSVHGAARRWLAPLTSVARSLESYQEGIERDLRMLQIGDGQGAISPAWNGLVRELARLREEAEAGTASSGNITKQLESRELRGVLDLAPCGVLRCGAEHTVNLTNATAAAMLRRKPEELIGQPLTQVLGDEVAAELAAGRRVDQDYGAGEDVRTLRLESRAGRGAVGERLIFMQDISHLKEAERTRDNFLYHVTHELRTPLTNISAYAETLSRPDFDDEETRKECYNVIISETQRLSHLVEDILNVSQLEVGTLRMNWTRVDLERLTRKVVQDNLGTADEKHIELSLELAPKLPEIRGDKDRLAVLLSNLIGNALKYTPSGGKVQVQVSPESESQVRIAVRDTGIGIGPDDQGNVFEKFYRVARDEVQAVKGTGIGLAICREIVNRHGGDIHLSSEVGRGSTFTVELPVGDLSALGAAS